MVRHISDRIGVMYLGKMMEIGESDDVYERPLHPYTKSLLSSIPVADPRVRMSEKRIILEGDVRSPINPKPGCRFASRCRYAKEICHQETPEIKEVLPNRMVACHLVEEINDLFTEKVSK
jgi:oligopeptide/dipeptide ABC transporter ATP-binding protein